MLKMRRLTLRAVNMICKLKRLMVMGMMILAGFSLVATDDKVVIPVGLVRSACPAPRGVNRFWLGSFREFQFGEKYIPLDGDVPVKAPEMDGELLVERKLENPWCGFEKALLCYAKENGRLHKIEQAKTFEGENSAKDADKCVQEVLQVCSRGFNSAFQKVVTASSTTKDQDGFSCVYVYDNQDGEFPIKISVLRKDNVRRVLLSIESARVCNGRLNRKNASYVAEKTNDLVLRTSPVRMKEVHAEPFRYDALSALISVAGGDVLDWSLRRKGILQFKKHVGPFVCAELEECTTGQKLPLNNVDIGLSGQIVHVYSTANVCDVEFESGVGTLRRVRDIIFERMRHVESEEHYLTSGLFVIQTTKPTYGGWRIRLQVERVKETELRFQLDMERAFSKKKDPDEAIVDIDVDI